MCSNVVYVVCRFAFIAFLVIVFCLVFRVRFLVVECFVVVLCCCANFCCFLHPHHPVLLMACGYFWPWLDVRLLWYFLCGFFFCRCLFFNLSFLVDVL